MVDAYISSSQMQSFHPTHKAVDIENWKMFPIKQSYICADCRIPGYGTKVSALCQVSFLKNSPWHWHHVRLFSADLNLHYICSESKVKAEDGHCCMSVSFRQNATDYVHAQRQGAIYLKFSVQVPLVRGILRLKIFPTKHFPKNICSWVKYECCCQLDNSNIKFTNKNTYTTRASVPKYGVRNVCPL